MTSNEKHKPSYKIWIEYKGKPLLGKGGAKILEQIQKQESISKAAACLKMSYRYVWNYLQKIEKTLGEPIVETFRGGKAGGGGARLTKMGNDLLSEYTRLESHLSKVLSGAEYGEANESSGARNRLEGRVTAIKREGASTKVEIELTSPTVITAFVPNRTAAVSDLKVGNMVNVKMTGLALTG